MPEERLGTPLSSGGFKRENLRTLEKADLMATFGSHAWLEVRPRRWSPTGTQRLLADVVDVIGDGKEATVYECESADGTGFGRAVAKVYRAQKFRAFSNAAKYIDAEQVRDRRKARAVKQKTRRGQLFAHHMWIEREWETLCRLYDAGADIPAPYAHSADAILMEYVGGEDGPAPLLLRVDLAPGAAEDALERLLRNVELFLACDRVHGDLSAYNVLWQDGPRIIDFPQSVSATTNPDAYALLARDVRNLCQHFARRFGARSDPGAIAHRLWRRLLRGEL